MSELNPGDSIYAEKPQIIRQSMRCFMLGAAGAIPFLGLSLAIGCFKLHRKLLRQTGESWNMSGLHLYWVLGLCSFPLWAIGFGWIGPAATMVGLLCLHAFVFRSHYKNANPSRWNPARHYHYWGVGLAHAGIMCAIALIAALIVSANWRELLGLK